jgi:hypothetical protein
MKRKLVAPIHNPYQSASSEPQLSLTALQTEFTESIRNLSVAEVKRIKNGQIDPRELGVSPTLSKAVELWEAISVKQAQWQFHRG